MSRTIIVSDLHIDTWTPRKIRGAEGQECSRLDYFFAFLQWCREEQITELIISGDLIDAPPYHGHQTLTPSTGIARAVLAELVRFARHIPVTYVFGNHDIGISGFRAKRQDDISPLRQFNFCYPDYVLKFEKATYLIEHGHFADPALLLYIRDIINRTYRDSQFNAFRWEVAHEEQPTPVNSVGLLQPVSPAPGGNIYATTHISERATPGVSLWDHIKAWLWRWGGKKIAPLTREWWWQKSLDRMRDYIATVEQADGTVTPTIYQIFGHTHQADPRPAVPLRAGIEGIYINAGSWAENVEGGPYIDIDADGHAWLQDWINETDKEKRVMAAVYGQ